jgi:uncharacterized protein YndB with AHSA1/START domain
VELSEIIRIERPIEEVFDAWAALDRAIEYRPGALKRRLMGEPPVEVGSRLLAVDRWPGFDVHYRIEVTAFERPGRIAATWSEPLSGGWDAIFEWHDGATELRLETALSPSGLVGLAMPLLGPWYRRRGGAARAACRTWLESERATRS